MNDELQTGAKPTAREEFLRNLWEEHMRHEFATRNTEETLATMVDDAYVNHIPVLTGGVGKEALREFYSKYFIPQMPPDTEVIPVSRTIGTDQLVDEMIFKFTHTVRMDWMLPGVAPTGRRVEIPLVAIVRFRDNKLAHEHIYWDRRQSWCNWACLPQALCWSPVSRPRGRLEITACLPTHSCNLPVGSRTDV